ncbi:MAG: YeeE/YedE family protein [Candidatus Puniceispirillum sp.]|nr:YeeE/YedE family protein [Candidatus Puniceispirillum sp.]MBL6775089.1 YeeE/YedE family protein [Candidatus Puniceispirillum sp.]
MTRLITALIIGAIFGIGLAIAGMLNPAKVVGFLDVFGDWDPSLALVMGGGVLVNAIGLRFVLEREAPIQSAEFLLPTASSIDKPLLAGSVIFGIGWGISGLCPGPVVASLLLNSNAMLPFFGMLIAGLLLGRIVMRRVAARHLA